MGKKTTGILADKNGNWQVDKWFLGSRFRQRGFFTFAEAEGWLIEKLNEARQVKLLGERPRRTFGQATVHYLAIYESKISIETEIYQLRSVMPHIENLDLADVNDDALKPFIARRQAEGIAFKTINLTLGVVRHILNLAANDWKIENRMTWLAVAPKITMLDLTGRQRPARPITWAEQDRLTTNLPTHLASMAIFALNTGARDNVVCNLRWSWEVKIPELGSSVFDVPRRYVKGRKVDRVLVCNSAAQSVIESVRGQHPEYVFVYRRERVKNLDRPAVMPYRPIQTMNNTAWQTARQKAGLGDLHVHDLRHTVGMRLREAGVPQVTTSDLLWHVTKDMTHEYTLAQLSELHDAIEKIREDSGRWNRSLGMLKREQRERQEEAGAKVNAEANS